MLTIDYSAHRAHLDPMTGQGVLILPRSEDDLWLTREAGVPLSSVSLQCADLDAVVADLARRGWTFSEPGDPDLDIWLHVGVTAEGRDVVGLYGPDSIISEPTLDEMAEADRELLAAAGVAGVVLSA